jgi:Tfp pilus assembly protein PilF
MPTAAENDSNSFRTDWASTGVVICYVCIWLFTVALSGPGFASEVSEIRSTMGLVALNAQRNDEALADFDAAVTADANDPYARYYRGVTHGRLKQWAQAIADLEAVPTLPNTSPALLERAAIELAVALLETDRPDQALDLLQRLAGRTGTPEQALLIGIAQIRANQFEAARASLQRAAEADAQLAPTAQYYLAELDYRTCNWPRARERLATMQSMPAPPQLSAAARTLLGRVDASVRPPYQLWGTVGFEYDSNVVLAPSDTVLKQLVGISDQDDGRVIIDAGALAEVPQQVLPWNTQHLHLSLGYEFFQSLHFQLHQFNLQDHRPSIALSADLGPVSVGLTGLYDYFRRDDASFLHQATALPSITVSENDSGRTEVFYRMRRRDFVGEPLSSRLDGFNHGAGATQYVYLPHPNRYLFAGYVFDHQDPLNSAGRQFEYDGHQLHAGIDWDFGEPTCLSRSQGPLAEVAYLFRRERYANQSLGRRDEEHQLDAALRQPLNDFLAVRLEYRYDLNNSNQGPFKYDRHIGTLALEARY